MTNKKLFHVFLSLCQRRTLSINRVPYEAPLLETNLTLFIKTNDVAEPTVVLPGPNGFTNTNAESKPNEISYMLPIEIGRSPKYYGAVLGEVVSVPIEVVSDQAVPGEIAPGQAISNQPIDIEMNIQVPESVPACDVPPPNGAPNLSLIFSKSFTYLYVVGGPLVPPYLILEALFWLAILLIGFWLVELAMNKFTKFMEGYLQARQKMLNSPETPEEQKRFGRFSDWLLGTAAGILTPELAEKLISNIANRWTRAILKVSVLLLKLTGVVGVSAGVAGVGGTGLIATKWLSKYFNTYLDKAVGQVTRPISASSDGRLVFLELVIKCLVGGFLAGSICRVICEAQENSRENVVKLLVQSGGLYFIFNDKVVCLQIAKALLDIPVIAMFLNSQLGRWAFILGNIRVLGMVERTPYTVSFYFIFVYLFRVFMYASMATPNLF